MLFDGNHQWVIMMLNIAIGSLTIWFNEAPASNESIAIGLIGVSLTVIGVSIGFYSVKKQNDLVACQFGLMILFFSSLLPWITGRGSMSNAWLVMRLIGICLGVLIILLAGVGGTRLTQNALYISLSLIPIYFIFEFLRNQETLIILRPLFTSIIAFLWTITVFASYFSPSRSKAEVVMISGGL